MMAATSAEKFRFARVMVFLPVISDFPLSVVCEVHFQKRAPAKWAIWAPAS